VYIILRAKRKTTRAALFGKNYLLRSDETSPVKDI
jgi:hypothetical protein